LGKFHGPLVDPWENDTAGYHWKQTGGEKHGHVDVNRSDRRRRRDPKVIRFEEETGWQARRCLLVMDGAVLGVNETGGDHSQSDHAPYRRSQRTGAMMFQHLA